MPTIPMLYPLEKASFSAFLIFSDLLTIFDCSVAETSHSQNPDHTEDTQEVSVESLSCVLGFRQLRSFPYDRGNEEYEHGDRNGQRE